MNLGTMVSMWIGVIPYNIIWIFKNKFENECTGKVEEGWVQVLSLISHWDFYVISDFLYGFRKIGVHDNDQNFSKLHSQLLALSVTFVFLTGLMIFMLCCRPWEIILGRLTTSQSFLQNQKRVVVDPIGIMKTHKHFLMMLTTTRW